MKIINFDEFKPKTRIILDGGEYVVKGYTVGFYLENGDVSERAEAISDTQEKIRFMVDVLQELTTIPREVLVEQDMERLYMLFAVIRGVDPTIEVEAVAQEGDNEKK